MKQVLYYLLAMLPLYRNNAKVILIISFLAQMTPIPGLAQTTWSAGYPALLSGATSADLTVNLSESGSVYYVVYNILPSVSTASKIKSDASAPAEGVIVKNGTINITSPGINFTALLAGLPEDKTYYFYLVGEGNISGLQANGSVKSFIRVFPKRQTDNSFRSKFGPNALVGYLAYVPEEYYKNPSADFPIMIFLHGAGEKTWNPGNLNNLYVVKKNGPPKLINVGMDFPFIVISPQCPFGGWDEVMTNNWTTQQVLPGEFVKEILDTMTARYRENPAKIFVTGLSMGGAGTWSFIGKYPQKVAAAIPIAGWADFGTACTIAANNVAVWAFQGDQDGGGTIQSFVNTMNACTPSPNPLAKATIYANTGHDSWERTYNNTGLGIAPDNIYDWLMRQSKPGTANLLPVVNAGEDKSITLPNNSIVLVGSATDFDGTIASYAWSKLSGPSAVLTGANSPNLSLTTLLQGVYEFQIQVTDNSGALASDTVSVTVNPGSQQGNGLVGEYFNNKSLAGTPILREDVYVNFNWSLNPIEGIGNDNFSVRWSGKVRPNYTETYNFYTYTDGGVTLWVNNVLLVNNWTNHNRVENSGSISLVAGKKYDIRMEYFDSTGSAVAKLSWSSASRIKQVIPKARLFHDNLPAPQGIQANYYNSINLTGTPVSRIEQTINFDWGNNAPIAGMPTDNFSVRWTGKLRPAYSQAYTFYTLSDDGVRLFVNGIQIINNWTDHGPVEDYGIIDLTAGQQYDIRMEFYEHTGGAVAKLLWSGASLAKEIIPAAAFSPSSATLRYGLMAGDYLKSEVNIYPVPANESMAVKYYAESGQKIQIQLLDKLSVTRMETSQMSSEGENLLKLDVSLLPPGIYYLYLSGSEMNKISKVLIAR